MTMTATKAKPDPRAKRRDETHAQWQARLDAMLPYERETGEPVLTPEALAQGDFEAAFVPDHETGQVTKTLRRKSASSMARLHDKGFITGDEWAAAQEIALVAEMIERSVSVRGASLESRVDSSGSARDVLVERLHMVRMEKAYTKWRMRLPMPKRMVIDMVLSDRELFVIARVHRVGWPRAKRLLKAALGEWASVRADVWRDVDERDVLARYARLGCGELA